MGDPGGAIPLLRKGPGVQAAAAQGWALKDERGWRRGRGERGLGPGVLEPDSALALGWL